MSEEVIKMLAPVKPRKRNAWAVGENVEDVDLRLGSNRDAAINEINERNIDLAAYRNAHEHLTTCLARALADCAEVTRGFERQREAAAKDALSARTAHDETCRDFGNKVERLHEALSFFGVTDNAILAITDGSKTAADFFPLGQGILKKTRKPRR